MTIENKKDYLNHKIIYSHLFHASDWDGRIYADKIAKRIVDYEATHKVPEKHKLMKDIGCVTSLKLVGKYKKMRIRKEVVL